MWLFVHEEKEKEWKRPRISPPDYDTQVGGRTDVGDGVVGVGGDEKETALIRPVRCRTNKMDISDRFGD